MVRMIPPYPRDGANRSERQIFTALEGLQGHDDWVAIHSVSIARHTDAFQGEADFIVLAPGRGILVIEAKSPDSVEYRAGDWFLDKVPGAHKDPLKQLDGARRSLRGFLNKLGILRGDEPIARLLWFTSLGRHQFENKTPGDLQFFEWELGWHDDLAKPARLLDHVFDEYAAWYASVDAVGCDPTGFTADHANEIADAIVGDFVAKRTPEERRGERREREMRLLAEQRVALELIDTNEHVYFDGPAGTGKSYLLTQSAKSFNQRGMRTLVTCWNVMMGDELQQFVGSLPHVDAIDLNSLMLQLCGLPTNPEGATHEWYTEELPTRALAALAERPHLGGYEAICVDEFQDVAGNFKVLEVLFALAGTGKPAGTRLVFASDARQQIMRRTAQHVDSFAIAKTLIPDLVHVRVRRNCRNVPGVTSGAESLLGQRLDFTGHRMSKSVPGGLERVEVTAENETRHLTNALRELLKEHAADDIVILSPFAAKRSLVGRFLARDEKSADERWLRKQLQHEGGTGRVRWRSIFKFKGLDTDAVIVTDIGPDGGQFVDEMGLNWKDLLYVATTRGKYRCVVLEEKEGVADAVSG